MTRPSVSLNDWRVQRFIGWLCTIPEDREPRNQTALAEELGVSVSTLYHWKQDDEFLGAWERQYRRTVGAPDKRQRVVDTLFDTATDRTDPRQVPAARAYLEAVDAIKPQKIDITVTGRARDLTDEELLALVSSRAEAELATRGEGDAGR